MSDNDPYKYWRLRTVDELFQRPTMEFSPEVAERHRIYSLALMAITFFYWNGMKYGRNRLYPLNEKIPQLDQTRLANDYFGHNICSFLVDGEGFIIDFEFNHNEIFNSSVEHAESRLLRRVFSLSQIQDSWELGRVLEEKNYSTLLRTASLYTTLESCAQCSGIMALAQLKEVIFLQTDPGQYNVGNIMRNLTESSKSPAPSPIPASWFGFEYFTDLGAAYTAFLNRTKTPENAFSLNLDGTIDKDSYTNSLTSYLCTKSARDIYLKAKIEFEQFRNGIGLQFPTWKPDPQNLKQLDNSGVMKEASAFVEYASVARRGTSHRS